LFDVDCKADRPGPRLVEAVEALVEDWWSGCAETVAEEMHRRPGLKRVVAVCDFDPRVPDDVRRRLYRIAGGAG